MFREPRFWWLAVLAAVAVLGLWWRFGRRTTPRTALVLRLAAVLLLGAALAQPLLARPTGPRGTVLVVDVSRSAGGERARAMEQRLRETFLTALDQGPLALVAFAERPALIHGLGTPPANLDVLMAAMGSADVGSREQTNIEAALRFADTLSLGSGDARIILFTDGLETQGRALTWGQQAAARGTTLDVVSLAMPAWRGDLRLTSLEAPPSAWQGGDVDVTVAVTSDARVSASLSLKADGKQVARQSFNAVPGLNSVRVTLGSLPAGYHVLEAEVQASGDPVPENNTLTATTIVRDRPRVLLLEGTPGNGGALVQGLNRAAWDVTVLAATALPPRLSDLAAYDAIILHDVSATSLSNDRQQALREFVALLGRGLVVSGASSSFGRGGYEGSTLEGALPVEVKLRGEGKRQPAALLLVLDRSYSMSVPTPGPSRIDMAKSAAAGAVRALAPGDQIAVLTFSDTFKWVTRLRTINSQADIDSVVAEISQVTADGETQMFPALTAAVDELSRSPLETKHIVLLSDGQPSEPFSVPELTRRVRDAGLTMSTIAIGDSADVPLMEELAKGGNGRYSFARRPDEIPMLTLAEAEQLGGKVVATGAFLPAQASASAILRGLDPGALPRLLGYDVTRVKPTAQAVLVAGKGEPILAQWQYGLGRVVVWTSDSGQLYAPAWREAGLFDRLLNQATRWTLSAPDSHLFRARTTPTGGDLVVTMETPDGSGPTGNVGPLTADIGTPDGASVRVALQQTGPGRYEIRIARPQPGAYRFDLTQARDGAVVRDVFGMVMPYPAEYRGDPSNVALLTQVATLTGGVVAADVTSLPHRAPTRSRARLTPIWYWFVGLGLLCFVADIAVRLGHMTATILQWPRPRPQLKPKTP